MNDYNVFSKKSLGGGTILDLGIYTLQFATYIFNGEKPTIKAAGHLNKEGVDESMSATLIYKNGRTATIATHCQVDLPNEAIIMGTKGMIKIPTFWCPTRAELPNKVLSEPLPDKYYAEFNFLNSAGFQYEANEVRECIKKGQFSQHHWPDQKNLIG